MALQCGIVGLPNVGKSTLFNCLSNAKAQAANFPFCTIEPNVGVITVPDDRLTKLAELVHPGRIVPTTVEIVDIAGLVKGASKVIWQVRKRVIKPVVYSESLSIHLPITFNYSFFFKGMAMLLEQEHIVVIEFCLGLFDDVIYRF